MTLKYQDFPHELQKDLSVSAPLDFCVSLIKARCALRP